MKATAIGPANIAFIKYWGKVDPKMRLPQNNSISMNLSNLYTVSTVEFDPLLKKDRIHFINNNDVKEQEINRVVEALDIVRRKAKVKSFAKVITKNNFPKASGIASSASGFSSIILAALTSLGVDLGKIELSKLCRVISGSACRSIPDGYVEWDKGTGSQDSYARQIYPASYWKICDVVAIVSKKMKKISSSQGHLLADTSPFFKARLAGMSQKVKDIKLTIKKRDFSQFGKIMEQDALNMHAICLTSSPSIIYWEPATVDVIKSVVNWREAGDIETFFTIDAGPSVHVICREKDSGRLAQKLNQINKVEKVVVNKPARGAHFTSRHLF